jgi:hypothetical protein
VTVPVTIKHAVVIGEEDKVVPRSQRLDDRSVPGPRGSAIAYELDVLNFVVW